jgi:hypothetical protein
MLLSQCAMARMGDNPLLLVVHANFLIEVRKDGQAARTQMQLAQKANPSMLDNYNIYVAQQLAKSLKRGILQPCLSTVLSWHCATCLRLTLHFTRRVVTEVQNQQGLGTACCVT